jgi:hypothetical protein
MDPLHALLKIFYSPKELASFPMFFATEVV